jgi:hypothetical protein
MSANGFQKRKGADSVVLQKNVWVSDASVHMSLRCNVDDGVDLMYEPADKQRITNVSFNECVSFIVFNVMQVSRVRAYAYLIDVYQFPIRIFLKDKSAKIAADET